MKVDLSVPDHTTLSRRNSSLKIQLKRVGKPNGRVDLVIDSTGLVIHGKVVGHGINMTKENTEDGGRCRAEYAMD